MFRQQRATYLQKKPNALKWNTKGLGTQESQRCTEDLAGMA